MNSDLTNRVVTLVAENQLNAALEVLDGSPPDARNWNWSFLKGWLQHNRGEYADAVDWLQKSLTQNPNNPDAVLTLGLALGAQTTQHRGWALVRDHAKQAIELTTDEHGQNHWPGLKNCLEVLASTACNVGPHDDAVHAYRALIKIDPNHAPYHEKLAELVGDDDLSAASGILEEAIRLNPEAQNLKQELVRTQEALIQGRARKQVIRRGRYPSTNEMSGEIKAAITKLLLNDLPNERFINRQTSFFTLGSCFAREIARKLEHRGYPAFHLEVAEHINSTHANRCMLELVLGTCSGQPKARLDEMFGAGGVRPEALRKVLQTADAIIYTLGVAPAFFEVATGEFVMPPSSALSAQALAEVFEFRTTSVAENLENLNFIYEKVKAMNPRCKFVLTVSPVPLRKTFEFNSALNADCLSKSTLRVTAHEFMQRREAGTYYWPSFEIVRWLGGHVGPFYGVDDGSSLHVSEALVGVITDLFIDQFSLA